MSSNPANLKILIAEDSFASRMSIEKVLLSFKIVKIEKADNGQEAWEKIQAASAKFEPFDLILSDWVMPQLSGIELLRKVKADPRFKRIPFALLTAEHMAHQKREADEAGVDFFLEKPLLPERLEFVLKKL